MYKFTVTVGIFQRGAVRRALCAAEDARAITRWTEPAAGYFRIESDYPELTLTDASGQTHTATAPVTDANRTF